MDIPRIILPNHATNSGYVLVSEDDAHHPPVRSEEVIKFFQSCKAFVVVEGEIRYQDVFREAWVLPFNLRWESDALYGGNFATGTWRPFCDPERVRNREYRYEDEPTDPN
jgi:hypothetical protein